METITETQQELFDIIEEANLFPGEAKKFTDLAKIGSLVERLEDYCNYQYTKGLNNGKKKYDYLVNSLGNFDEKTIL